MQSLKVSLAILHKAIRLQDIVSFHETYDACIDYVLENVMASRETRSFYTALELCKNAFEQADYVWAFGEWNLAFRLTDFFETIG